MSGGMEDSLCHHFLKDGVVNHVNPYKQNAMARECGIDEIGGKKLF